MHTEIYSGLRLVPSMGINSAGGSNTHTHSVSHIHTFSVSHTHTHTHTLVLPQHSAPHYRNGTEVAIVTAPEPKPRPVICWRLHNIAMTTGDLVIKRA